MHRSTYRHLAAILSAENNTKQPGHFVLDGLCLWGYPCLMIVYSFWPRMSLTIGESCDPHLPSGM